LLFAQARLTTEFDPAFFYSLDISEDDFLRYFAVVHVQAKATTYMIEFLHQGKSSPSPIYGVI
jgi:hypothetical protein